MFVLFLGYAYQCTLTFSYLSHSIILNISNGQATPDGKQPIILYTLANETVSNSITNSYFGNNFGLLIGAQAGKTIIKDNVFYNNTLREVSHICFGVGWGVMFLFANAFCRHVLSLNLNSNLSTLPFIIRFPHR